MKYLKTNEALFTGKSEKVFEKLIQNFENKLREEGLMEITHGQLSENPISIFGLMDPCKKQALSIYNRGNKSRDFYQTFPIDDIRDRLYDLSDELGVEFKVEKIETGIDGYDVEFDLSIKFEKREHQGFHYVEADMDLYSKLITELNNLYKVFDSMGLTLYFDPFSIIHNGSVYIEILEKKEKPDGE